MKTRNKLNCFKAYDVRGKLGEELNEKIAYRIGKATVHSLKATIIAVGFDARETSPSFAQAVAKGICDAGADVLEIGLCGTEEIYSAVSEFKADAGIEITASHNPIDYNGMKIVKDGSQPLTSWEFANIKRLAEENICMTTDLSGSIIDKTVYARETYIEKILSFVNLQNLKPLKIVINSGNGAAGPTIDALNSALVEKGVKTNFVYVHHDPDPLFPNGIPNPLLTENRSATADAVILEKAEFGVAFDGDFDRCFLFDHKGNFIPGEYLVGLLTEIFLNKEKGGKIVHDPRVVWNTIDVVNECNGNAVVTKTGHAFVKAAMRNAGAIYGGEMSAHHYFRDFYYCDSGMIPWLMLWELLSKKKVSLGQLITERFMLFPSSGELNFKVSKARNIIRKVKATFSRDAISINEVDGLSMTFENWRFNLRQSNTEPLIRLNVETRGNQLLLKKKTKELKSLIDNG